MSGVDLENGGKPTSESNSPATAEGYMSGRADFQFMDSSYTDEDKALIVSHLTTALSNLKRDASEFEIAAAINDYVYQYFISNNNNNHKAPSLLRDGFAWCGGSVNVMIEMLHALGIQAKNAFLIGIPNQGAHSMVEVYFQNETRGLFDPTYGIFYYDKTTEAPVSILETLKNPEIIKTTLHKSARAKRVATSDKVAPFTTLSEVYALMPENYREKYYQPYLSFNQRMGGGVAWAQHKSYIQVRLKPGMTIGDTGWRTEADVPWQDISFHVDDRGRSIPWLYSLGQTYQGYDVKHVYQMSGLNPGSEYVLNIYYADSKSTVLSYQFVGQDSPTCYSEVKVTEFKNNRATYTPCVEQLKFVAVAKDENLLVDVTGYMIVTAIRLEATGRIVLAEAKKGFAFEHIISKLKKFSLLASKIRMTPANKKC